MSIPPKQIGWSTESNLLWQVAKGLDKLLNTTGAGVSNIIALLNTKVTNELGVPSFYANTFANLPAPGVVGRMFVSTDTFAIYRDNGTGWNLIGGPGTGSITGTGVAGQVSFWNGTSTQTGDNGLWWDNINKRFGIGTNTPQVRFHTFESGNGNMFVAIHKADNTNGNSINLDFITSVSYVPTVTNFGGRLRYTRLGSNGVGDWDIMSANSTGAAVSRLKIFSNGNVLIQNGGTFTDAGFRLDVNGTTRLNGLQTFQGTTASDTAPLGSELATTGSGTNWTGTDFATGYTHVVGSTASLTTSLAAVNGTYYQIAYTITGRTAGSITINYGGTSTASITATGATGPLATSTADLEIVPTTDFDGTVVLSVRSIGTSSATTSFTSSNGNVRIEMRANTSDSNTLIGISAGRRITTGGSNSFVGVSAGSNNTTGGNNSFFGLSAGFNNTTGRNNSFVGVSAGSNNTTGSFNSFVGVSAGSNNTTGSNNSFFGLSAGFNNTTGSNNSFVGVNAGLNNTTGGSNSFVGVNAGRNNTTGSNNSFVGVSAGQNTTTGNSNSFFGVEAGRNNTTGINNSFIGLQAGLNNTTGESNSFIGVQAGANNTTGSNNLSFGRSAGRLISSGGNLTIANNSVFLGFDTRANADNESNQIAIGYQAIGLGSNTTVIGNSSTTFGRWWGSLLVGTSTNEASSILTLESTTKGFLFPRMTGAQAEAISSPAEGLLVYSTDGTGTIITSKGWWGFNGSTWEQLN